MSGSAGAFGRPFKYWVRRAALRIIERAPLPVIPKWTVVRGDTVTILSGRSAGKTGKVKAVLRRENRVVVEGLNLVKRHVRPRPGTPGGVIAKESPLHVSNVQLVDPPTGKPTRVAHRFTEDGKRVRMSKRSGSLIPTPPEAINKAKPKDVGPKDTPEAVARAVTYVPPPELVPYLTARTSDLYRVRVDDAEKKPLALRRGLVDRKVNRNRMLAVWRNRQERARLVELSQAHGLPLPPHAPAAAPAAAGAELR